MANTKITSKVIADDAILTANITDANVTTAKIAADAITGAKIADDVALGGNPTTTTQSAGNNTTRVATTAFVSTAVSNLVDSSPSALNTLNELAAALGDDANFSTTVTNSIAAKLPLAGGTMTGALDLDGQELKLDADADTSITADTDDVVDFKVGGTDRLKIAANNLFLNGGTDARIQLGSGGAGANQVSNNTVHIRGDGVDAKYMAASGGDHIFESNGGHLVTMKDSGNVGIGTTTPSRVLHTQGASVLFGNTSGAHEILFGDSAHRYFKLYTPSSPDYASIRTGTTDILVAHSDGKVGIGTTSPSETLHVKRADGTALIVESSNDQNNTGDRINIEFRTDAAQGIAKIIGGKQGNYQSAGARSGYLAFQTINANSYAERMRITSGDGIVGIGVSDPKSHIHTHIASSGGAYHQFTNASTNANSDDGWKIGIHDDENFIIWGQESSESFKVYNNGAYRLTVDHNGAVSVAGSFSKGSGSFKIDHPLPAKKDTHHLVHSFVEAPQADLIYRGTATLSSGSATVNLDTVAGMTEGTYVLLNTNSSCFTSNETDWDAVKGSVSGNTLTITCQNDSSTATVSWLVIGERHDQHMKDTEWTDDNGKVIVEPLKEEE